MVYEQRLNKVKITHGFSIAEGKKKKIHIWCHIKTLDMLFGSQESSEMGSTMKSGEQAGAHPTSTKSHNISGVFQAVLPPHTYSLSCPRVGRGTRAGGEGACSMSGITPFFCRGAQWGNPTETLNLVFVHVRAICATYGHGAWSQAAIWDLQAELQEAASSSLLVLLNSMTILGLTFSIHAASGTKEPSRQTSARPHCFNQPPLVWQGRVKFQLGCGDRCLCNLLGTVRKIFFLSCSCFHFACSEPSSDFTLCNLQCKLQALDHPKVFQSVWNHHFIEPIFSGEKRLDRIRDAKDASLSIKAHHKVYNKLLYGNLSCEARP